MKVAIIGSGEVARSLAAGFSTKGHEVVMGTRSPEDLAPWAEERGRIEVGTMAEAAAAGELVVLAVKGAAAAAALRLTGARNLAGKTVVDATNPIADEPPDNGVLKFFTRLDRSLMEDLQEEFPEARFVKAFNSVGNALMVDPQFAGGPPTMFICGDDAGAKRLVEGLLEDFGWESADMGGAEAARAIEPLCILWCLPGFLRGEWNHAFKLLR